MKKRAYKSKKVAAVCETSKGVAEYFNLTWWRVLWLLLPGTFVIEIIAAMIRHKRK